MGKTANEVMRAVQYNESVTELELKCALTVYHSVRTQTMSAVAKVISDVEKTGELDKKSYDKLKRAWDSQEAFGKDLETYILGSSYDPRLNKEERNKIFSEKTANTALKLLDVLGGKK